MNDLAKLKAALALLESLDYQGGSVSSAEASIRGAIIMAENEMEELE